MGPSAWFDCSSGASGDMVLGALLDAGAPLPVVREAVDGVVPGAVRVRTEDVLRGGIRATKVHMDTEPGPPHRAWRDIRALLHAAPLGTRVRDLALAAFGALADAEGAVHGTSAEDVHFHEVGALDAIADVVGACAAFDALGVDRATATPLALGSGRTRSAHGELPVPAPAVTRLLADHGVPAHAGPAPYELCTPTGAALMVTLCSSWGALPPLRLRGTGTGAGTRDPDGHANVVRVVLGERLAGPAGGADDGGAGDDGGTGDGDAVSEAVVVDANVDDLDPRVWPHVLSRLLASGADDAWLTPILMKKGRPAHTLSVLCRPARLPAVREVVLTETSTIGLREHPVRKRELARDFVHVPVGDVTVRVKVATRHGRVVNAQPEYDDVAAAAGRLGLPVKTVLARAFAAAMDAVSEAEGVRAHQP